MSFMYKNCLMFLGLILLFASMFLYIYDGYSVSVLLLWLFSMVFTGVHFLRFSPRGCGDSCFTHRDFLIAAILALIIGVFYLSVDPAHPMQMIGDEIHITIQSLALSQPDVDMFKPTYYANLPAPFFAFLGYVANLFGPIDVINVRLAHTIFGIILCVIGYFFFQRVFSDQFKAVLSTLLLASSPSLFAISHISTWNNSAIFVYILSVLFLLIGLRKESQFYNFIGGVIAGFGWYVYSPAKSIIFVWIASLAIIALLRHFKLLKIDRFKHGIFAIIVGFSFAICPFIVGALTFSKSEGSNWGYLSQQFMFSHDGRSYNKDSDIWYESVFSNALNSLTVFNNSSYNKDAVYYLNQGKQRFVDPLSGVFLWIGVLFVSLAIFLQRIEFVTHTKDAEKRGLIINHQRIEMVVVLFHFLLLLFAFMFLVNLAPHYARFLIILPFFVPLVIVGSLAISRIIALIVPFCAILRREIAEKIFLGAVCSMIMFLSVGIFADYVRFGVLNKRPITDAIRYIHDRSESQQNQFYFFDHQRQGYYLERWDASNWQQLWINLFVVFNHPPKDLDLQYFFSYGKEWLEGPMFSSHREPIANTVYYIINQISKSPHHFYLIKDYQEEHHPAEFLNVHDWKIWLNLFTVFKQPFDILAPEDFLITSNHKFPTTFFVPDHVWNDVRDRVSAVNRVVDVRYLSSRNNLLIVRVDENLSE